MTASDAPPVIGLTLSMLKLAVYSPRMGATIWLLRAFPRLRLAQRRKTHFLLAADAAHILNPVRCHDENLHFHTSLTFTYRGNTLH